MDNPWHYSPRDVDLLSWFTGPLVPILLGGTAATFGLVTTLATTRDSFNLARIHR